MPNKHTGKEYGFEFLIRHLQNYFKARAKFESLSREYIDKMVKIIIMNNNELFTKDDVLSFRNGSACHRCGRCCLNQKCNKYDSNTKLCKDWKNRDRICRDFPYGNETIYLDASCSYVLEFFRDKIEIALNKAL